MNGARLGAPHSIDITRSLETPLGIPIDLGRGASAG